MTVGPGSRIGPYTLLEQIGEGRNSLIFIAAQLEPMDRIVALKVIKPEIDSKEVVARFNAERQALAMMDHPNIVHVLDAGSMESGRLYFVMELIRGAPITDFCDQGRLDQNERLALFAPVCSAVQHAHQKGIIHRDIEPSNVLVTLVDGRPFLKLIDFGAAKASGSFFNDPTIAANFPPQMIGRPASMSPEQALTSPFNVDSRSDVYSLGVLLYELMTGSTPLENELLATTSDDEIRGVIRDANPPSPSQRLSEMNFVSKAAASHKTTPEKLSRKMKGKLDAVVMKAIEKDRDRRYQTADALATDIDRCLKGESLISRPSIGRRVRNWLRRSW